MPNRLAVSTSPYLLQHKDNPVDWYEWGAEAFERARQRDVPVILSVGYAACHWCHVMAHESFEDPDTAAIMNDLFVSVKVDREERPDVDSVYMEAVQAMTGQGGWPMTVFLTPDREPFYAGTYFPPEPRHGMPSFRQVLQAVTQTWTGRRTEVTEAATGITRQLAEPRSVSRQHQPPTPSRLAGSVLRLERDFDALHAGYGGAPKFPPSMVLEFLLRHHARTGDPDALSMVERTCERMARGGLYDQLAGGFARYSVDREWVVPHFEKMLYDNALLLRVYLHWWRATGSQMGERIVRETARFLLDDLRLPEGGFASALDADADGEEGSTYVWTPGQLREVLGEEDGRWAGDLLVVTDAGTFEHGASTLQLPRDIDDLDRWYRVRARLLEARTRRPQPARDAKVVTAWNGLAIAALAEAGALLDEPEWLEAALSCADLLWRVHLTGSGRLVRTSMGGRAGTSPGVLEDYGDLAEGFLTLLAVTGQPRWLSRAEHLLEVTLEHFADPGGAGFFDTADDSESLIRRPQDPADTAAPSGWTATAGALLTFAAYTGSIRHRQAAEEALGVVDLLAEQAPRFAGWGMAVAEAFLAGPLEVAVVGPPDDPAAAALRVTALMGTSAGSAVILGDPADPLLAEAVPLLANRPLVQGSPAAYVCRHFTCDAPVTAPAALAVSVGARAPVSQE